MRLVWQQHRAGAAPAWRRPDPLTEADGGSTGTGYETSVSTETCQSSAAASGSSA